MNENRDEVMDFVANMERMIGRIASSPAMPEELKLHRRRSISIGSWWLSPKSVYLPEYTEVHKSKFDKLFPSW